MAAAHIYTSKKGNDKHAREIESYAYKPYKLSSIYQVQFHEFKLRHLQSFALLYFTYIVKEHVLHTMNMSAAKLTMNIVELNSSS